MANCQHCKRIFGSVQGKTQVNAQPIFICPEATLQLVCTDCCESLSVEELTAIGAVWFEKNHSSRDFEARKIAAEGKVHFQWDVEFLKGERETRPFIPAPLVID